MRYLKSKWKTVLTRHWDRRGALLLLLFAVIAILAISARPYQPKSRLSTLRIGGEQSLSQTQAPENEEISPTVDLPPYTVPTADYASGIPRLALLDTTIPNRPQVEVETYIVKPGDNLFLIAEKYGLKPETILWGNYEVLRDNPQFLKPDQELNILPTDGVYYQWNEGDNLLQIADFFKVEPKAIIDWPGNQMELYEPDFNKVAYTPSEWIVIPGGRRALKDWGPPPITRSNPASAAYYGSGYCGEIYEGAIGIGTFIWPTVSRGISGYDYNPNIHPALDIEGAEGNAIFATDSGVVVFSGWSEYGYGYLVVIDHGNGWQSAYAHMSAVGVNCGQSVAQGTLIGAIGNTGNSTGAHLHFELRSEIYGKANPWDFVSP